MQIDMSNLVKKEMYEWDKKTHESTTSKYNGSQSCCMDLANPLKFCNWQKKNSSPTWLDEKENI